MATTIANTSKETVSNLIRKEFDALKGFWQHDSRIELLMTARDFGLIELATELQNDL